MPHPSGNVWPRLRCCCVRGRACHKLCTLGFLQCSCTSSGALGEGITHMLVVQVWQWSHLVVPHNCVGVLWSTSLSL